MVEKKATLIITEKPQAAAKIAAALSDATDEKITTKDKVSYYEFYKESRRYIVGCAVGHLFGVQQKALRGPFPNFEIEWKPAYKKKRSSFTKKYLNVLKKLVKECNEFIVATDYDVEGEVIGLNVVRFVAKKKDAKRMKFSLLTKEALQESFKHLEEHINWGAAISGETRHYLDWFYGINLSRGLMKALSSTGTFRILSIGRVQGPALEILVTKEKEIQNFKSEPFWNVFLQVKNSRGEKVEVAFSKDIFNEKELLRFKHLQGKNGTAKTTLSEKQIPAPTPFDLTTLQTEAYKHLGLTPTQTLKIAQSLYLKGAISYPRTSSQEYPASIGYTSILKKLKKYTTLTKYAVCAVPTKGKKTDPAHPAIYPTGDKVKIAEGEKRLHDLIVKRFISCFCEPARILTKKISVSVGGLMFSTSGKSILKKGWTQVYPHSIKEREIESFNGDVDVIEIRFEEKETKPPRRYSAASLVKELEKRGLGTKATRAGIVETLYSRGYAREKSIEVTELGMRMEETLKTYSPVILDEEMTKKMTEELEKIERAKSGYIAMKKKVLETAKKEVSKIAEAMKRNIEGMGKSLADANAIVWEQEKEANTMTECPKCHKGKLRVMYGKRFSRYFVSCDNYPTCKTIFSLPPKGVAKPSRLSKKQAEEINLRHGKGTIGESDVKEGDLKLCEECSWPEVSLFKKGGAPWRICFNPDCPRNEEAQKKKAEFKAKLASGEIEIGKDGKIVDHGKEKKKAKKKVKRKKSVKKEGKKKVGKS